MLFDPIRIGTVELRNRVVFPPMTTGYEENGAMSSRSLAFYRRLARGGAGLIVLGDCSIQPAMSPIPMICDDKFIPGLRQLTGVVQTEGAKVAAQLFHQEYDVAEISAVARSEGREAAFKKLREDMQNFVNRVSLEQIARIQGLFVAAAVRAREAGFDMIQIHGDRLIGMFCSPVFNRRTDAYGGSMENRMRFALEVVQKVRAAVPEMAIDYKLAVIRTNPQVGKGGPTLEEAQRLAPWLVKVGVNSLHVCQANHTDVRNVIPPAGAQPYGCFVDMAAAIKGVVDVPVSAVGRIVRPDFAESILQQGKADLVCLGRGLLADPEWPLKAYDGRETEIRECIMCNRCTDSLMTQKPVVCAINGQTGPGVETELTPVETARRVVVVGGGAAGLEAARVAALRGCDVTLLEKSYSLGGQLRIATVSANKEEMKRITSFLAREMARLGVDVRPGTEATPALIRSLSPDKVIVATGASPKLPDIQGANLAIEDQGVVDAWKVLAGQVTAGDKVIVVGGSAVGLETADLLASQGKQVTVLEMTDKPGQGEAASVLPLILARLQAMKVEVLTKQKVVSILIGGVVVTDELGIQRTLPCDTVVIAANMRQPNQELMNALQSAGIAFTAVGDCAQAKARLLGDAIHEGYRAGLEI